MSESAARAAALIGCSLVLMHALLQVLALGRNTSALQRLRSLDARVVAMPLMPDEPPLQSLQAALGGKQVGGLHLRALE